MHKYSYAILICLFSQAFCQKNSGDTFFLDMGVVIKSENVKYPNNSESISKPYPRK